MDLATSTWPAFLPVIPPAPKPWTGAPPIWRRLLQLRRSALPTWGPGAYEGSIFSGPFLGKQSFLLNDPDAIRQVLVDNPANYGRTPASLRILHPMIGDGLLLSEGAAWKFQRRTAAPAFAPRSLEQLARVAAGRTDALIDQLATAPAFENLLGRMQRLALEIAGEALFSQALGPFAADLRTALEGYGRRAALPSPLDFVLGPNTPTPALLLRRRAGARFQEVVERILAARRREGIHDPPRDLFDALVAARDPETGRGFDTKELRDQIATLVIAGHETTALSLFWALYLLAIAPDVQAAIAAETAGLALGPESIATDLGRLPLTRAVVQETLRLYPPVYSIVRQALRPDRLGEVDVPAGALIVIAPWLLHRHKQLWLEPVRFDPARFLPGAVPPKRFAYLPFGAGPRVCIGAQFATSEAVVVLAKLVQRFAIDIPKGRRILPRAVVTLFPDRIPRFRLQSRGIKGDARPAAQAA